MEGVVASGAHLTRWGPFDSLADSFAQGDKSCGIGRFLDSLAPNDKRTVTLSGATSEVAESKGPPNQRKASLQAARI
jgi:hypothetical protein